MVMAGLTGIENTTQVVSGKIFSTLGQAYAFMGDESISENWFESALEKWSGDVANQNITLSYLMNLYVDTANMGGYEKYAPQYFGFFDTKGLGCDSVAGQLKVLKEAYLNRQFIRYALSVFVKAFYKFYNDSNSNLYEELVSFIEDIENNKNAVKGEENRNKFDDTTNDPWQHIYKYMYLIARDYEDEEAAEIYAGRVLDCTKGDATISVMQLDFEMEHYLDLYEGEDIPFADYLEDSKVEGIKEFLSEFPCFDGILDKTVAEAKKMLEAKLTYMFR